MIWWRKIILAGVAGYVSGNIYSQLRKHPETTLPIIKGTAVAAITGSSLGLVVAWYRDRPLYIYSISLGANFGLATVSFLGFRHGIIKSLNIPMETQPLLREETAAYIASGASGLAVGTLLAVLSKRGLSLVALNSLGGLAAGIVGQFMYDQFELWRKRKAIELNYHDLVTVSEHKPWSFERFEAKWLEFWHRELKTGKIESQIMLLEECMKEEKQNLELLDVELAKFGHISNSEESSNIELNTCCLNENHQTLEQNKQL